MPQPNEKECKIQSCKQKNCLEHCPCDCHRKSLENEFDNFRPKGSETLKELFTGGDMHDYEFAKECILPFISHQRESIRDEMDREWREREKKIIEIIKDSKAVFFVKKEDVEIPADEQLYELKSQIITDVEMYFYTLSLINKGQKENK